jgi:His/Glu/Gln/Arg/opine family amino acid ABC transporter permease subunit
MRIRQEKLEFPEKDTKFIRFIKKYRPTWTNIGWYFMSLLFLIIFLGFVNAWINPEAHYFDPIIAILDFFMKIFGKSFAEDDPNMPSILRGLASGATLTFIISLVSVIIGFVIGAFSAIILVNSSTLFGLKFIAQAYVDFFRSTPLLVQILLVYFGLPRNLVYLIRGLDISFLTAEIFAGTLALSLNTGAYQAEIIRGGILAIPTGQTEAARALGLSSNLTMNHVILPQAIRIIVPPLTNELINVLLNSSLISAIGVLEITKKSQSLQSYYFRWQVFIYAAVFYFAMAYSISKLTKKLEIKLRIPGLGVSND